MTTNITDPRQLANQQISEKLALVDALIAECEQIADTAGVSFSFSGPTYGMGGYYTGTKTSDDPNWDSSDETGWNASSQSC